MKVFLSTADASGDLHAAALAEALSERVGELELFGLGGAELAGVGMERIADQSDVAIAGLFEVLSRAPGLVRAYTGLRRALRERDPDVAVFVDSPDLNLPLAAVARRAGVPVVYYVAPQVWAWRSGRVRQLRRRADRVAVIFPFEVGPLRHEGVDARFVGHPLVDRIAPLRAGLDRRGSADALGFDPDRPLLGLLPGSRHNEIEGNLEVYLDTAAWLQRAHPQLQVCLALAPTLEDVVPRATPGVQVVRGQAYRLLAAATALLAAPGTVTLEAALFGTPLVVGHRAGALSFEVARRLVRVPSSCMVNLIAGEGIVPERLQQQANPASLAAALAPLLFDPQARAAMSKRLLEAAERLGEPGAARRAADLVLEVARRS